ncbi:MAG: hypothetical protein IT292_06635 [Deltaproteobacteria bacterium]|nr:hypothetical protein [Deltaproteobacteria bacterium]
MAASEQMIINSRPRATIFFATAFNFAYARKRSLVYLAIPCFITDLISTYISYYLPLGNREVIYLSILNSLPTAWLIAAIMMLMIDAARGGKASLRGLSLRAISFLPKIYFSFIAVSVFIAFTLANPLLIFFAIFFTWAPAFAVADTYYAPVGQNKDDDEVELFEDEEDGYSYRQKPANQSIFFSQAWNVGLVRSINLAGLQLLPTLSMTLLFWIVLVLPMSSSQIISGGEHNLFSLAFQVALSSVFECLAIGVWAALFILLLPQAAEHDLGLLPKASLFDFEKANPYLLRLSTILLAIVIAGASSIYLVYQGRESKNMPAGTVLNVNKAYIENKTLVFRLLVTDTEKNYRWLLADRFLIAVTDSEHDVLQIADNLLFDEIAMKHLKFIPPQSSSLVVYDSYGKEVPGDALSPRSGTLEIVARYPLPDRETGKLSYALFYKNQLAGIMRGPLLRGVLEYEQ